MKKLREEYNGRAEVLALYIAEAHARDEWPISSSRCNRGRGVVSIPQAVTMEQRMAAAAAFVRVFDFQTVPMYCDAVDNAFGHVFGAWPLRFYIVAADGTLRFAAMPQDCVYSLSEVKEALDAHCK
eukprot:TRINITY_DN7386_c0_g1_i1.p3 TRINITY_DN7386_c0_g1~~TRINITY_DN7386_c0_g1_i1.p3  ORF type:complete len:126 (-),score=46.48 TRINITY_DN7386_c0_g1_i1:375-752(-)